MSMCYTWRKPFTATEPTAPPTLKLIPSNVVPGHKF